MTTTNRSTTPDDDAIRLEIDREMALIESAARLVNLGAARRVTIGNLPLAGSVVARTQSLAAQLRVTISPIFDGGERAHAVAIDREGAARA